MAARFLNVERRDTGARHMDATADEAFMTPAAVKHALEHHAQAFQVDDLHDFVDGALLHAVKVGNVKAAGALLVGRYRDRIAELATWSSA